MNAMLAQACRAEIGCASIRGLSGDHNATSGTLFSSTPEENP
jgi:hypothetical protein